MQNFITTCAWVGEVVVVVVGGKERINMAVLELLITMQCWNLLRSFEWQL